MTSPLEWSVSDNHQRPEALVTAVSDREGARLERGSELMRLRIGGLGPNTVGRRSRCGRSLFADKSPLAPLVTAC